MSPFELRAVTPADVAATRALRLEALRAHPEAFGSAYEDLLAAPEADWHERLRPSLEDTTARMTVAVGAGGSLAGMAGVSRDGGSKVNHSAYIWSVYVRPAARGHRLADELIVACIAWCSAKGIRNVRLSATASNAAAIRCYQRLGFQVYGVAPEVIRIGDVYHDEILMWRRVS